MVSSAQAEALAASMIDVGFVRRAVPHLGFEYQLICSEPLLVAMPSGHPLAQKTTLAVADLDRQPFVRLFRHTLCT